MSIQLASLMRDRIPKQILPLERPCPHLDGQLAFCLIRINGKRAIKGGSRNGTELGRLERPGCVLAPAALVALDVAVNATNERGGPQVSHGAAHDAQTQAEHERVAKVEGCLEEARHLGLEEEVVDAVQEDVQRCQGGWVGMC